MSRASRDGRAVVAIAAGVITLAVWACGGDHAATSSSNDGSVDGPGGEAGAGDGGCAMNGAVEASLAVGAPESYPYVSDMGDGTYRNPIVLADYSDPDVIRVGEDYYLVASSFTNTPGLPILHSRDLVNWTLVGHALVNVPGSHYAQYTFGTGVWAPSIREHDGTFYIFFPTPDEGIYVVTSPSPLGPWSVPSLLVAGAGFEDPCPLWDDDGKAYLIHAYVGSRTGGYKGRLNILKMSPDATQILDPGPVVPGFGSDGGRIGTGTVVVGPDPNYPTLEGPKFYKRNGWYYILAPAGGVMGGFQAAFRSKTVYGPYEAYPKVLEQGTSPINGPHQGGMVDTPSGNEWWFVHFQDTGLYGRILHLEPVTWMNDWPLLGMVGDGGVQQPVLRYKKPDICQQPRSIPQAGDDFKGPDLSPAWQWHANHVDTWYSLTARPGHLRLFPQILPANGDGGAPIDLVQAPNLLLQKLPALSFDVDTVIELSGTGGQGVAGIVLTGASYAGLSVTEAGSGLQVSLLVQGQTIASDTLPAGPVHLQIAFAAGGQCRFSYGLDGGSLRSFSSPYMAQPLKGSWNGVEVGIFAVTPAGGTAQGQADFSYFRFGAFQ
ncbi:MAG: glycoside hydrolase 43 family protein [Myxococcota bacterium]|nr:glycoside hydrolase 43 family protein [Myxococcota bacterium]